MIFEFRPCLKDELKRLGQRNDITAAAAVTAMFDYTFELHRT